jgi:hypothetical protein
MPNVADQEIDLTDAISAQGRQYTVSILAQPTLEGTDLRRTPAVSNKGSATAQECSTSIPTARRFCALYTPPKATITVSQANVLRGPDTFRYEVCVTANNMTTCEDNQVSVPIGAGAQDFAEVKNLIKTNSCLTGCHSNTQSGAVWNMPAVSPAPEHPTSTEAWCALRKAPLGEKGLFTGALTGDQNVDPQKFLVNVDSPADSLLYTKPQTTQAGAPVSHNGGSIIVVSPTTWAPVLKWISEGGDFTDGPAPTNCPP